ncbi:MAG: coenzyme-B sulfoethylthiotransferase subunit beta [Candidatus Helarchaeota archaeon]
MKYSDKIDVFDDMGNNIAEDLPIESLSPLINPFILDILNFFKRTAFVNLKKLEFMLQSGQIGYTSSMKQDEIQISCYTRPWEIIENAEALIDLIKKKIQVSENDDSNVVLLPGNEVLMVQLPKERIRAAAGRDSAFSIAGEATLQAISEVHNITPLSDPDGCNILKSIIFGRYPQTRTFPPRNPLFTLLHPFHTQEGLGNGFRGITINHIVALTQKRTFDAVILSTILEQASQFEMGNTIGWFERYNLLGMAYQSFNADRVLLDLIDENKNGTVGDVVTSLVRIGIEDDIIKPKKRSYPYKLFSGYKIYSVKDYDMWNAYTCAGLLAAVLVNCGASRSAQSISSAITSFCDLLMFESGGLPDPDCGRVMGTGLGLSHFNHDIFSIGGTGLLSLDNVLIRNNSGFVAPCLAAAMSLDSGTQLYRPEVTSEIFFKIREADPIFKGPLINKVVESALEIKHKI